MARKKKFDYFEAFETIAKYGGEYAAAVADFFEEHFDEEKGSGEVSPKDTLEALTKLHEIEDKADVTVHEVLENLAVEFMTPIEREDILSMVYELDDIVDELDDVLQRMYMYNVTVVVPELIEMSRIVQKTVEAVKKACKRLANYKKAKTIKEQVDKISELEDEGDVVYIKSVHSIYVQAAEKGVESQIAAQSLAGVLQALERCCDACEAAGDTMVTVVMKNN